jgi:hypothetical protein
MFILRQAQKTISNYQIKTKFLIANVVPFILSDKLSENKSVKIN